MTQICLVLRLIKQYFSFVGAASLHLAKCLPLRYWMPYAQDVEILGAMLKQDLESPSCKFAQYVFLHLAWSDDDVQHMLPPAIQQQVALLLLDALSYHKKSVAKYYIRTSPVQQFASVCQTILLSLKVISSTGVPLMKIQEFTHPSMQHILANVKEAKPSSEFDGLSAYLLFTLSTVGHSLAMYHSIGKQWLEYMTYWNMHELIVRLMIDLPVRLVPQSLDKKDEALRYGHLIDALFSADSQDSLVGNTFGRFMSVQRNPGIRTARLSEGICICLRRICRDVNAQNLDLATKVATFWIQELMLILDWLTDTCVMKVLNDICLVSIELHLQEKIAFVIASTESLQYDYFQLLFIDLDRFYLALVHFLPCSRHLTQAIFSVEPCSAAKRSNQPKTIPYLRLFIYVCRFGVLLTKLVGIAKAEVSERQDLGKQMVVKKLPYENASKQSIGAKFAIYRVLGACLVMSQAVMEAGDAACPILPLYWQLFFSLYFESVVVSIAPVPIYVGHLFLDVQSRNNLYTEAQKVLDSLCKYYGKKGVKAQLELEKKYTNELQQLHQVSTQLADLYNAMNLWLKDSKSKIEYLPNNVATLPEKYNSTKLISCLNENISINSQLLWVDVVSVTPPPYNKTTKKSIAKVFPNIMHEQTASMNLLAITKASKTKMLDITMIQNREKTLMKPPPVIFDNETTPYEFLKVNEFDPSFIALTSSSYSEALARNIHMDNEYSGQLPQLYQNVQKMASVEVRCFKQTFCTGPAYVSFSYQDRVLNKGIEASIQSNRKIVAQLLNGNYINFQLLVFLLRLQLTIDHCVQNNLASDGIRWFFLISGSWDKVVAQYPPIQQSFVAMMNALGDKFIASNPKECYNLLQLMLGNSSRIELLCKYFNPNVCPSNWKGLLELIYGSKKSFDATLLVPLFKRFNAAVWLEKIQPDTNERRNVLDHCNIVLIDFFQHESAPPKNRSTATAKADADICACYSKMFIDITSFMFPELAEYATTMLVNNISFNCISPSFVAQFAELPYHLMDTSMLQHLIMKWNEDMWKLRQKSNKTLYDSCSMYLVPIVKVFTAMFTKTKPDVLENVDFSFDSMSQRNVTLTCD